MTNNDFDYNRPNPPAMRLEIQEAVITKAITDSILRHGSLSHSNPIIKAIQIGMEDASPIINQMVLDSIRSLCDDPDFRKQIKAKFRESLIAEAESMGRKAARAAVNAAMDIQ